MVLNWRCSDCGLTNSVQRNKCQACFADISTGIMSSVHIKDEKEHDMLLCGFVRQMTTHFVPDDIMIICRSFYPSTVTIHVGSFGFDTKGCVLRFTPSGTVSVVDSYIKIPELYGERNLFEPGETPVLHGQSLICDVGNRGHGLVVLENRFGTLLRNKTIDTFRNENAVMEFMKFLWQLESNCILIMAVHDSGDRMSHYAHILMSNYGVGKSPGFRQPMIFVGSTNGVRDWTFYKVFDRYTPGRHEQVFTVPLQS